VIRKKGGKYCLYSRKSGRNLGCSRTKAGARQREREVQYFKSHPRRRDVRVRPHRRTVATHMITREVPRSGVLVPPRQRKSRGKIFAVDEVVGDDKYIFLSVEDIFSGVVGDVYVFDAERLVHEGALVRKYDIAMTKEWEDFIRYTNMPMVGFDVETTEEGESLYGVDKVQSIHMLIDQDDRAAELYEALMAKRENLTLRGAAAINFLHHPEEWTKTLGSPEILVPKRLPLSQAEGVWIDEL